MNTTIRNRATALGIAAIAGIAGLGFGGGSALATTNSTATTTVAQAPQSAGHPNDSADYADEMVRGWGVGSDSTVKDRATQEVVDALSAHGDGHVTRWHRIGADGAAGSTHVAYANWETGEVMILRVNNERAASGDAMAVRQVKFHN